MPVIPTSQAPATVSSAENKSLIPGVQNVESAVVIIGEFDVSITSVVADTVKEVFNEADVGAQTGFGWPIHQLAKEVFTGNQGVGKVYMIPQTETGTVSDGEIAWSAGPVTAAGTLYLRIDNILYPVIVPNATTLEEFSDLVVAKVNSIADAPVVAAKTAVTFETTLTAKAKGLEGDNHTITLNAKEGESDLAPVGITGTITPMANGAGVPDITDALTALGSGNGANGIGATHIIHNYGQDVTTQAAISAYQGEGNELTGLFAELVGRNFYGCLVGDTATGTAGFAALKAITDLVVTDRVNGFIAAPDEDEYPQALAARATGIMARIAQINPSKNYYGQILSGMGGRSLSANRWTDEYDGGTGRDDAARNGISPTFVIEAAQIELQNVFTFYRPTSIPLNSNGFRSMRSNAITRNVITNIKAAFADTKGKTLVNDKSKVTDPEAKKDVMDVLDVETRINNLIDLFVGKGWLFESEFAKKTLDVQIRTAGNGFDATLQWVMSGEVLIIKVPTIFDTNIAAFAS